MEMSLEQSMHTIIPWINSLPPRDCALFTMDSSMKDGRVIAGIVESLTGIAIPDFIRRPRTVEQREINFNAIINHFMAHYPNLSVDSVPAFIRDTACARKMAEVCSFTFFLFIIFPIYTFRETHNYCGISSSTFIQLEVIQTPLKQIFF